MTPEKNKCGLCGEPMPEGEQMFKFHGYSGDCPKPPMKKEMTPEKKCNFVFSDGGQCKETAEHGHGGLESFTSKPEKKRILDFLESQGTIDDSAREEVETPYQGEPQEGDALTRKYKLGVSHGKSERTKEILEIVEKARKEFKVTYESSPFYNQKLNEDETKFGKDVIKFLASYILEAIKNSQ